MGRGSVLHNWPAADWVCGTSRLNCGVPNNTDKFQDVPASITTTTGLTSEMKAVSIQKDFQSCYVWPALIVTGTCFTQMAQKRI